MLPGPQAGGVVSAVICDGGLVLLDRAQTQLLALPWQDGSAPVLEDAGVVVDHGHGPVAGLHLPQPAR